MLYPIDILFKPTLKLFEQYCGPEQLKNSIERKLYSHLSVEVSDAGIVNIAEIKRTHVSDGGFQYKICVNEAYCQFLWTLCYTSIIIIDETIIRENKEPNRNIDRNKFDKACNMLEAGLSLFQKDESKRLPRGYFYDMPNPQIKNDSSVNAANNLYMIALCYVLIHEYSHFELGHLDKVDNEKEDEINADIAAYWTICNTPHNSLQNHLGCLIGLTSLFFVDETLEGDTCHPDIDVRLEQLLLTMESNGVIQMEHMYMWAVSIYKIWAYYYHLDLPLNDDSISSWKEYYELFRSYYHNPPSSRSPLT